MARPTAFASGSARKAVHADAPSLSAGAAQSRALGVAEKDLPPSRAGLAAARNGGQRPGQSWPSVRAAPPRHGSLRRCSFPQSRPTARRRRNLSRPRRAAGVWTSIADRRMTSDRQLIHPSTSQRDKVSAFRPCRSDAPAGRLLSTRLRAPGIRGHAARLASARPGRDR